MNQVPKLYYYFQLKLSEHANNVNVISKEKATLFFRHYRIPKALREFILAELELLGLVETLDKKTIRVINCDAKDFEDFCWKIRFNGHKSLN